MDATEILTQFVALEREVAHARFVAWNALDVVEKAVLDVQLETRTNFPSAPLTVNVPVTVKFVMVADDAVIVLTPIEVAVRELTERDGIVPERTFLIS